MKRFYCRCRQCSRCEARLSFFLSHLSTIKLPLALLPRISPPLPPALSETSTVPTPASLPTPSTCRNTAKIQHTYSIHTYISSARIHHHYHHRMLHATDRHTSSFLFSLLRFLYLLVFFYLLRPVFSVYLSRSVPLVILILSYLLSAFCPLFLFVCLFLLSSPPSRDARCGPSFVVYTLFPVLLHKSVFLLPSKILKNVMDARCVAAL